MCHVTNGPYVTSPGGCVLDGLEGGGTRNGVQVVCRVC